jgi:hypothetical protein
MKVQVNRTQSSGGVAASSQFGISKANASHIMTILRDTLYTDRILAVLREYASNGWDAHRSAGKADQPIKVTLPTTDDPNLYIRDFGNGLSEDDVLHVYTQYGDSTKRDTDDQVGMMGIGCKSGFAYSDTFTVVSYHGGMKRIYVATLDKSNLGLMQRLHEEPCNADETGIEIQIPVKEADIWRFDSTAKRLFRHFNPQPIINIDLPTNGRTEVETGYVVDNPDPRGQWMAVMGCIPYRIDIHQIQEKLTEVNLWDMACHLSGGLFLNIGEVRISASREELKYEEDTTDEEGNDVPGTNSIIFDKIVTVLHEYIDRLTDVLRDDTMSPWEKRLKGWALVGQWGGRGTLPFAADVKDFCRKAITLWKGGEEDPAPKTFTILTASGREAVSHMDMDPKMAFYYRDDDEKHLQGYRFSWEQQRQCFIIRPYKTAKPKAVRAELALLFKKVNLTGVPVVNLSSVDWREPPKNEIEKNIKHRVTSFKLVGTNRHGALSNNWETITRVPTDDDVFEVISHFTTEHDTRGFHIFSAYEADKTMADIFGVTLPDIYGYKTTARKEVTPEDCKGTQYRIWRKGFFRRLLENPDHRKALGQRRWANVFGRDDWHWRYFRNKAELLKAFYERLETELGADHPVTRVFTMQRKSQLALTKLSKRRLLRRYVLEGLPELDKLTRTKRGVAAEWAVRDIRETYPLLDVGGEGLHSLCGDDADHWFQYVKLVDDAKLAALLPKGA